MTREKPVVETTPHSKDNSAVLFLFLVYMQKTWSMISTVGVSRYGLFTFLELMNHHWDTMYEEKMFLS